VGNLTDQFTTMSMDVDQECVRSDWLEEQVGRLESELDAERSARVHLTVDLRQALDMCNSWADRAIELRRDVNMLRARITGDKGTRKQVGTCQEHCKDWNTLFDMFPAGTFCTHPECHAAMHLQYSHQEYFIYIWNVISTCS